MGFRDYFVGQPVRLNSLHSPHMVAERINAAAGSIFWPFNTGVVGDIWFGRIVRLRFSSSFIEYNAKPLLAGRLHEAPSGSTLTLRYRAPAWAYVFDFVWYSLLSLVGLLMLGQFGPTDPDFTGGNVAIGVAIWVGLLVTPLVLHYAGTRNSDEELGYLLDFLAEHADAKP